MMKLTRRQITQLGLLGLSGLGLRSFASGAESAGRKGLSILVLGGTGFLGPHIVRYAVDRGHKLTLFNRGTTDPHLFPELEKLKGSRSGDLAALKDRQWDVVIDTSSFMPNEVAKSSALLAPNAGHCIYISSTAVYKGLTQKNMGEDAPVYRMEDPEASGYNPFQRYGAAKVACEDIVSKAFPGRSTNIRSNTIVGPGDNKHFRYAYWVRRASQGGEILGPGAKSDCIQFIDVRDLGEWIIHCAENSVQGTYTASSPAGAYTMNDLIVDCQKAAATTSPVVWVESSFLIEHSVLDIPFWLPNRDQVPGDGYLDVTRAQANGLKQRPTLVTASDTHEWFKTLPEEVRNFTVGISLEQERQLLASWKQKQSGAASAA